MLDNVALYMMRPAMPLVLMRSIFQIPEHSGIQTRVHVEAVTKDFQEQVEDLHSRIAHELETLDGMRKYQRENCVPLSVCQHFEQCIKETEVDIQKMLKQNEFLEQSIEELEEELKTILSQYGMTEKDTRRLWNKVNLSKVLEYGRSLQESNVTSTRIVNWNVES